MAALLARPERITPSLTVQPPLGPQSRGPGLVLVSPAGASTGCATDAQQAYARDGYIVAHLKLSPSYEGLRIRDELREATEALSFHDQCSDKSRYGIIVYAPSVYPSVVEAIDGNGEIKCAVFSGEPPRICRKPYMTTANAADGKESTTEANDHNSVLEFLKSQ